MDAAAPVKTWDTETDPLNPQPIIYPVCGDCGAPCEYRRFLNFNTGEYVWAWAKPAKVPRGCRHKSPVTKYDPATDTAKAD